MSGMLMGLLMMCSVVQGGVLAKAADEHLKPLQLPKLSPHMLYLAEFVSLELPSVSFNVETEQHPSGQSLYFFGQLRAHYYRALESKHWGYGLFGTLEMGGRVSRPQGQPAQPAETFGSFSLSPSLGLDLRYYMNPDAHPLFITIFADTGYTFGYGTMQQGQRDPQREMSHGARVSASAGLGGGRIFDVGSVVRFEMLASYLRRRKLLRGKIGKQVRRSILLHWYALRNRIGFSLQLAHTLALLKKSRLLRRALTSTEIYTLINIIRDPQLSVNRLQGWRVHGVFHLASMYATGPVGEVVLPNAPDPQANNRLGIHLYGIYGKLFGLDKALFLEAHLFSTLGVLENSHASLGGRFLAVFHKFFYNEAMDGLGGIRVDFYVQAATALADRNNVVDDNVLISPGTPWLTTYWDTAFKPATLAIGALDLQAQAAIGYLYFISQGTKLSFTLVGSLSKRQNEPWAAELIVNVSFSFGVVRGSYAQVGLSS